MSVKAGRLLVLFVVATMLSLGLQSTAHAGAPGAPTGLTLTPGNTQMALAWTAPASDGGGGGIATYHVEHSTDGGSAWSRAIRTDSTAVTYTITGLTNGTSYLFRVLAVNGSDVGPEVVSGAGVPVSSWSAADSATYSACPTGVIPAAGFSDTSSVDVDCIAYYGITKGTTATTYTPTDKVTRWQMALFLTRMATRSGITLGDGSGQGFADVSGYSAEIQTAINQIKQLGITVGKTATTYGPADNVTREEMALFITRLLKKAAVGPGGNQEYVSGTTGLKEIKSVVTNSNFTDISQGTYEVHNAIANLWNLGATDVQTSTNYEPTVDMIRSSMATFMARALAHTSARPKGLILQPSSYRVAGGTAVTMSVTHRADDFSAIAGSSVDTFRFNHTSVATIVRFDAATGYCTVNVVVSQVGNVKCTVDTGDYKTDANGNLAIFSEVPPTVNKVDVWAWTSVPTTYYDNDIHAADASKITVESY